jgi:hypothetical protein
VVVVVVTVGVLVRQAVLVEVEQVEIRALLELLELPI